MIPVVRLDDNDYSCSVLQMLTVAWFRDFSTEEAVNVGTEVFEQTVLIQIRMLLRSILIRLCTVCHFDPSPGSKNQI